jgi:hypothetical protein
MHLQPMARALESTIFLVSANPDAVAARIASMRSRRLPPLFSLPVVMGCLSRKVLLLQYRHTLPFSVSFLTAHFQNRGATKGGSEYLISAHLERLHPTPRASLSATQMVLRDLSSSQQKPHRDGGVTKLPAISRAQALFQYSGAIPKTHYQNSTLVDHNRIPLPLGWGCDLALVDNK